MKRNDASVNLLSRYFQNADQFKEVGGTHLRQQSPRSTSNLETTDLAAQMETGQSEC